MKKAIFRGCGCALVTPFDKGNIDFSSMDRLIDLQLGGKTDALIVCGTTGEAPTLSDREKLDCFSFAAKKIKGKIPLVAGTGSNDTAHAKSLSKEAENEGADALLIVTPYYNKANKAGLIRHYMTIADSVDLPIIVYNVPSRTGCNLTPDVMKTLSSHENIVAIKEASGDIRQSVSLLSECDCIDVFTGNDELTLPLLSLGGKGVISVAANLFPAEMHEICDSYFHRNTALSKKIFLEMTKLFSLLFSDVNPIPLKASLDFLGYCKSEMRLPLCLPEKSGFTALFEEITRLKILLPSLL